MHVFLGGENITVNSIFLVCSSKLQQWYIFIELSKIISLVTNFNKGGKLWKSDCRTHQWIEDIMV